MMFVLLSSFIICFLFEILLSAVLIYYNIRDYFLYRSLITNYLCKTVIATLINVSLITLCIASIVAIIKSEVDSWIDVVIASNLYLLVSTNVRYSTYNE